MVETKEVLGRKGTSDFQHVIYLGENEAQETHTLF
jgi:hypothetical protein